MPLLLGQGELKSELIRRMIKRGINSGCYRNRINKGNNSRGNDGREHNGRGNNNSRNNGTSSSGAMSGGYSITSTITIIDANLLKSEPTAQALERLVSFPRQGIH